MKLTCQLLIILWLLLTFFACLYQDFHGKKAREPYGFSGAVVTVIMVSLLAVIAWGAGAFSELAP